MGRSDLSTSCRRLNQHLLWILKRVCHSSRNDVKERTLFPECILRPVRTQKTRSATKVAALRCPCGAITIGKSPLSLPVFPLTSAAFITELHLEGKCSFSDLMAAQQLAETTHRCSAFGQRYLDTEQAKPQCCLCNFVQAVGRFVSKAVE